MYDVPGWPRSFVNVRPEPTTQAPTERPAIPRPEPMRGDYIWPSTEPRPNAEQRAYFNRHLIGAVVLIIQVLILLLVLALVLGIGLLMVRGG